MVNRNFIQALLLAFTASALATPIVTVSGTCTKELSPDRSSITLTAEESNPNPGTASKRAQEKYNELRNEVLRLKLPNAELRTSDYSVFEIREWENNKSVSKGYRARMGLKITSSALDRMSALLALAAKAGVKDVGALSFFLSDKATLAAKSDCLEEASVAGRHKAERIAKSLGRSLGSLVSVQEEGTAGPVTPYLASNRAAPQAMAKSFAGGAQADSAAVVDQGTLTLQLSVTSTYELK